VNLASRITDEARPGTVLVTDEVRERVGDGYSFSKVPPRRLKGIKKRVTLFRARGSREEREGQE
jgi:adenylate cyclase